MTKISHISWGVTTKGGYDKGFYGIIKLQFNIKLIIFIYMMDEEYLL